MRFLFVNVNVMPDTTFVTSAKSMVPPASEKILLAAPVQLAVGFKMLNVVLADHCWPAAFAVHVASPAAS